MILNAHKSLAILPVIFFLISCGENTPESETVLPEPGIHVSDGWARPGAEDGNSAVYLLVTNGYSKQDTIQSVETEVAGIVEVHESYEREEGMMGMRQIEELQLPPQSTVRLEPGGIHIMLMKLNRTLKEGDQFIITLNLASGEKVEVTVPVRMRQDRG